MSEEATMDKNIRVSYVPPKSTVSEKGKQDVSKSIRNGRSRVGNYYTRQDASNGGNKKPVQQKYRNFDKRSKPRGYQLGEREKNQEVAVDNKAEIGSAQKPGSKKVNLNHLLNFTYSSRGDASPYQNFHSSAMDRGWRGGTRKRAFNKEQFLQANCKFVVKDSGDYSVNQADPDVLVDWCMVEEVHVMSIEEPLCPICLYPPQSAKITRCGHVYCWPCMLHYLALSDKMWRKCPICYETVRKDDLKSLRSLPVKSYKVHDNITMKLMCKQRGTTQAVPVTQKGLQVEKPQKIAKSEVDDAFVKLFTASSYDVLNEILNRERVELQVLLAQENGSPESCFIEEALQLLKVREDDLIATLIEEQQANLIESPLQGSSDDVGVETTVVSLPEPMNKVDYVDAFEDQQSCTEVVNCNLNETTNPDDNFRQDLCASEGAISPDAAEDENVVTVDDLNLPDQPSTSGNSQQPKDVYFFYQSSDGQPIYLHALNIRMLVKEYGNLDGCPETITAKIMQIEGSTMDESLRKRLRYLNHLPLHREFLVVELQLTDCHVSTNVLKEFFPELEKRKRMRNKKTQMENRHELFIKREEEKKMGIYPSIGIKLDSRRHFPSYDEGFCAALTQKDSMPQSVSPVPSDCRSEISECSISSAGAVSDPSVETLQTSFAQMLRGGMNETPMAWPRRTVDVAVCGSSKTCDDSSVEDDFVPAPDYNKSFSDAIQAALDNISPIQDQDVRNGSNGKKKKNKKRLLFSTNANRGKY